ncbi:DNA polymerase I [hydrothermal vent metagenome]|uniref:DNA-directed DNA polymerase n=1 Tax=hydrothermal vent metagenome TaxID=652676 RepID=A0A1W1CYC8_9ZZZZ
MKTITIIDTFGFFFRSYFALPPLRNSEGFPTGLLTGFINLVDSLHREHSTDYLVFALDTKGKTFRNDIYPAYKANRDPAPEDLVKQLPIAIEWIEQMGFANLSREGFEADDVIATVTKFAKAKGMKVRIVSHDKDLYQMIEDGKVEMYDSVKRSVVNEQSCMDKFGVSPKDFINFQAIIGDSSDNIAGVKGIGKVGGSKLINKYHTLEAIYEDLENCGTPRTQKLLLESKEMAFLSRELVTMRTDVFADMDVESFVYEDKNYLSCLLEEFEQYEMKQAIRKAKVGMNTEDCERGFVAPPKVTLTFEAMTLDSKEKLDKVIASIPKESVIAFDTETTGLDTKIATLVGFSFCYDKLTSYYVPIAHNYLGVEAQVSLDDALKAIKRLLKLNIIGQNLKFDFSLLENQYDMTTPNPYADTMIMAWLSNPSNKVGLDTLAKDYFGYEMKPFKDMVKKGEDFSSVAIEDASFYAGEDAWITFLLYTAIKKNMELSSLTHLLKVAKTIEYPFISVLMKMERLGIEVNSEKLKILESQLSLDLETLTKAIYSLANSEFNIKSTQQLAVILFETLGLKGGKKTKTGYSTNEAVLKSLIDAHEIIPKILAYREYQKILSTYIKPLIKLASSDENSRVYTSFGQTGTATGRLSSRDPNLQNIPVRSALGRSVREAFVAKEGYTLVSIDYSQIELRLLAHYSQDEALLEAFNKGVDIHLATSTRLFGEEQAQEKRNFAKSINFGLLYGMGAKKLSEELGITSKEAKEIISNYFASFPTVKSFLENIQEAVKVDGYVETILRRRRIFDYENANGMQKAGFMRESVNTVFQGSASDLIKLSMNEIDALIEKESLDAFMLLQIHDELIFEVKEEKAEEISQVFRKIMENIFVLDVPLECSVSIGKNWGVLK